MPREGLVTRLRLRLAAIVAGDSLQEVVSVERTEKNDVEALLATLEGQDDMTAVVTAGRLLLSEGCAEDELAAALECRGGWLERMLVLEDLGAKRKLWRQGLDDETSYPARVVRKALHRQGRSCRLALMAARWAKEEGGPVRLEALLEEVKDWWHRTSGDGAVVSAASFGQAPPAAVDVPPVRTRDEREGSTPPATVWPDADSTEPAGDLVESLLALNINQHRGKDADGWYARTAEGEVVAVLCSRVSSVLRDRIAGCLRDELGGVRADATGALVVQADANPYDVYLVDGERARVMAGEVSWHRVTERFDPRHNSSAKHVTLKPFAGMKPDELPACPRCREALARFDGEHGSSLRCTAQGCSFSVMFVGAVLAAKTCEMCGETVYQNRRRKFRHVGGGCGKLVAGGSASVPLVVDEQAAA